MGDLRLEGMALADGVVETIVGIAMGTVEGATLAGGAAGLLAAMLPAGEMWSVVMKSRTFTRTRAPVMAFASSRPMIMPSK